MNELTIGWWMIPASLPVTIFLHAALLYRESGDRTNYIGAVVMVVITATCSLLARAL
jgi:hypothetical protein